MKPSLAKQWRSRPITAIEKGKVSILFFSLEWFSTASLLKGFMINPLSIASFLSRVTRVKEVWHINQQHIMKLSLV